jgi:hypothetical protein
MLGPQFLNCPIVTAVNIVGLGMTRNDIRWRHGVLEVVLTSWFLIPTMCRLPSQWHQYTAQPEPAVAARAFSH